MNKLDEIINHLAEQEPRLDNADLLCDEILGNLPPRPQRKPMPRWQLVVRCVTSAAAILLLVWVMQPQRLSTRIDSTDYSASLASVQPAWRTALQADASAREVLQEYVQAKRYHQTIVELKNHFSR